LAVSVALALIEAVGTIARAPPPRAPTPVVSGSLDVETVGQPLARMRSRLPTKHAGGPMWRAPGHGGLWRFKINVDTVKNARPLAEAFGSSFKRA
jgi:hypothetical protein